MIWITIFVVAGVLLIVVAVLGRVDRLPRNWVVGVRTKAALSSPSAWKTANRAGAPWQGASGGVLLLGAVAMFMLRAKDRGGHDIDAVSIACVILAVVLQIIALWASARATRRGRDANRNS